MKNSFNSFFFFHELTSFYTGTQAGRSPYLIHYLFLCTYFAEQRHGNRESSSPDPGAPRCHSHTASEQNEIGKE